MPCIQKQLVVCVEAWGLPSIHLYLLLHKNVNVLQNEKESGDEDQAGWFGLLV